MIELSVPKMNCLGCVKTITERLDTASFTFEVDLDKKVVRVDKENEKASRKLIKKAGFQVL